MSRLFIALLALLPTFAMAVEVGPCGDQSKVPKEKRIANTPKWTLASQQDTFGFDVFRGEKEDGPFTKITKDPILGAGTTDETHKYEYRDDAIDPCKDYWYYVEEISTAGAHSKFTPTFKAPAKRVAKGTSTDVGKKEPPAKKEEPKK